MAAIGDKMRYTVARYTTDAPPSARPLSKITKTWIGNYRASSENPFSLRRKLRECRRTFGGQRFVFAIQRIEDISNPQPTKPQPLTTRLGENQNRFIPPPEFNADGAVIAPTKIPTPFDSPTSADQDLQDLIERAVQERMDAGIRADD